MRTTRSAAPSACLPPEARGVASAHVRGRALDCFVCAAMVAGIVPRAAVPRLLRAGSRCWRRRLWAPSGEAAAAAALSSGARSPFDRQLKRKQKNWAAARADRGRCDCDYLRLEVHCSGLSGRWGLCASPPLPPRPASCRWAEGRTSPTPLLLPPVGEGAAARDTLAANRLWGRRGSLGSPVSRNPLLEGPPVSHMSSLPPQRECGQLSAS